MIANEKCSGLEKSQLNKVGYESVQWHGVTFPEMGPPVLHSMERVFLLEFSLPCVE